ncbi:MAG TPA: hypothetical protein VKK61_05200 [Tepidisphaeraceae bacterium]|nr:hypothetical protein [Tepidisphaeraceae bacterium]
MPFFIWNPVSFFRSVVLWQLRQPFRTDALSFAALMDWTLGVRPGMWFCAMSAGAAMWLAYRRSSRDAFGFVTSLTFVLLLFFATNKQAFCNYYFLVMGVACGAIALSNFGRRAGSRENHLFELSDQRRIAA